MNGDHNELASIVLERAIQSFKSMKKLGEKALEQLDESNINWAPKSSSQMAGVL